ncbi:hypothetical protein VB005_04663 [Metarhizium brunneum]
MTPLAGIPELAQAHVFTQLQTQTRRELENLEDALANLTPFFHDSESDDPEADESTIDDYDDHDFDGYEDNDGAEDEVV